MVPSVKEFEADVSALGISNDDHIVVYDTYGILTSARVWWLFKIFGHDKVSVLDGGLLRWIEQGHPVTAEESVFKPTAFKATTPVSGRVIKYSTVLQYLSNPSAAPQLVDARPSTRFQGESLEPRVGIPSGHIPGSLNTPLISVVDQTTGTLLPAQQLKEAFETGGVDLQKPIVATCGSGVTACGLVLALDVLATTLFQVRSQSMYNAPRVMVKRYQRKDQYVNLYTSREK
ncbi:Rhodanese-like protein [Gonapodya prolifera JEL478]|uniref:Rhodanese-like protein n=1 Tax=Gonapodya prolifera (strain JEL478) TaxID=1344416 RepID=A0A138ZZ49_GONPJ|nr:Rhodanese-like protein [Gonapodya prolifera JEL478]|eukprot:KXS09770.1 Rhodanese-like protein [Gonapodya prolifera JEL478]